MELWDVYDREGHKTGVRIERTRKMKSGQYHMAVELWIVDQNARILIQKRAQTKRLLPGIWALTTGCVQAGESSREGAAREAREELGVALDPGALHFIRRIIRAQEGTLWDIYGAYVESPVELVLQAEEVSQTAWVTAGQLEKMFLREDVFAYPEAVDILHGVAQWARGTGEIRAETWREEKNMKKL
jgi:isopentenyldiphosphate isomerase